MSAIDTEDSTSVHFEESGPKRSQPIMFHPGWAPSAGDGETQFLLPLLQSFLVVALRAD